MKNEQELQARLIKAQEDAKIMRQLATPKGFYNYWFSQLPNFKTRLDCFNHVNDLYLTYFGEEKYSTYDTFMSTHRKKNKKK